MTIKELYEWAIEHDVENFDIEVELYHGLCKPICEANLDVDRLYEIVGIRT